MNLFKRLLPTLFALLLCISLAACNDGGKQDPQSSSDIMTASDFDAELSQWQGDDGSGLILSLSDDSYTLYTWYGRVGTGSLFREDDRLGLQLGEAGDSNSYYLIREDGGFALRHVNGEEGKQWGELNGVHFQPSAAEFEPYDISILDGVWQNALGKTIAYNTELMRFIECSGSNMSSAPIIDQCDGRGAYISVNEILYPCLSRDGNSLVLYPDGGAYAPGSRCTGVFYRNGDVNAYADLKNACFEESDGRLWYYDGMQYFALPDGYTLGDDGQAYGSTGKPFAPDWSDERYDPADIWGDSWTDDNWGKNDT